MHDKNAHNRGAHLGRGSLAFGAVIISFPTATLGTAWMTFLHNLTIAQSFGLYATLGFLTLLTVLTAALLAED